MLWLTRIRNRFRSVLHRDVLEDSLRQEFEFHLEEQKAEYRALGMNDAEADAAARRALGPVTALAEQCRDQRRTGWFDDFVQDTRFALRSYAKAPAFTLVAVCTLALGIGANTTFFSAVYGILFRPLPYPDPGRLVNLDGGLAGVGPVTALRDMATTAEFAGYQAGNEMNLQVSGEAWRVRATAVTANLAHVLGVSPARGRWFRPEEERAGKSRVAVIGDRAWRERFSSEVNIVGRSIVLNDQPFVIVGVMPRSFTFPSLDTELWIPIRVDPRDVGYIWGGSNLQPVGRLHNGASLANLQAELGTAVDRIRGMFPWRMPDLWAKGTAAVSYAEALSQDVRPKLFALSAAALLLLLIACSNVANLLLARAVHREREFAMREALGARRGRLLWQLITESLVLVVAGGAAGLLLAWVLLASLPALLPKDTPRLHEIAPDPSFVLVAVGSMLLTVALFSAAPLLRFSRSRRDTLSGRATTASRRTADISLILIGVELSLATVLLIGAGLMGRTLWRLAQVDSGIHAAGVVTARMSAGPGRCAVPDRCWALLQDLNQTILGLPGVRGVSWSNAAPLDRAFSAVSVDIENHPQPPGAPAFVVWQTAATPAYFETLGIRLRAGRFFNEGDHRRAMPVVIISEATAKRFWPGESALGKQIRPMSDRSGRTVVGVVTDVQQFALTGFPSWVDGMEYVPLAQTLAGVAQSIQLTALISTSQSGELIGALPLAIRRQFHDIVVSQVGLLDGVRSESLTDQRSTAWLLGLFAVLGLALGVVGVHGVIAHRAAQRRREIGIRMVMGATAGKVVGMVVRETLLVSVAGCAAGMAAAAVLSRFLQSLLFGVTPHDTMSFGVFPAILLIAAVLAAAIPAWRATRIDPALTLRDE